MGLRKVSILIGCLLAALIIVTILGVAIKPAAAASTSLPEGARLGSAMGFGSPFMFGMNGFFGRALEDIDDIDMGFGGMMGGPFGAGGMMGGPFGYGGMMGEHAGSMNPWMQETGQDGPR